MLGSPSERQKPNGWRAKLVAGGREEESSRKLRSPVSVPSQKTRLQPPLGVLVAFAVLGLVGWSPSAPVLAQGTSGIRFDRISVEDGLSQADAFSVLQDSRGFLWVGTQEGLSRWDGYHFRVFRNDPNDPRSLSHNSVRAILEGSKGNLWIGTLGGGLNRFDRVTESFTHLRHDPANANTLSHDLVSTLLEDSRGSIWVGTDGGGLNRVHPPTGTVTRYSGGSSRFEAEVAENIRALWEDDSGILWVGTDGGGLLRFDPTEGLFHTLGEPGSPFHIESRRILALHESRDGWLWIGTHDDGLFRARLDTGEVERFRFQVDSDTSLSSDRVRVIHEDADGTMWIGTDSGVSEWDPVRRSFHRFANDPADSTSLSANRVVSIYQDRGGVLWFGTMGGGLSKWNPSTRFFRSFKAESRGSERLSSNTITSFAEDRSGNVWVGTYGGGINRLDARSGEVSHYTSSTGLPDDRVMALFVDSRDALWIGTRSSGLSRLDRGRRAYRSYRHDSGDPKSLSRDEVTAIVETADGSLLVGTFQGGLNRLDPATGSFSHYRYDDSDETSLSSDRVIALEVDAEGEVWIGTEGGGLDRLDLATSTFDHNRHRTGEDMSLSSDVVFSILAAADGTLWVGTQRGLNRRYEPSRGPGRFRQYRERDGLLSEQIFGILEDEEGFLWLTTNNGLARLDPRNDTFRHFDLSHGLVANEFNSNAYFRSSAGEMYIGGSSGFNSFFPGRLGTTTSPPPVVLTRFQKFNRDVPLESPLSDLDYVELAHGDKVVSFEFSALDFTAPENNSYSYRLEGFDRDWVDAGTIRRATYTNLRAGDYVFRARATNNLGVPSEDDVAVRVRVLASPWSTWWAYALYATAALMALGLLVRSQARKRHRESEYRHQLLVQVEERTRELAQRNEELDLARRRFEEASLTDPLTGLRNRRYLSQTIAQSLAPVDRFYDGLVSEDAESRPDLAFLVCDLDRFKEVNDRHGHAAGNQVLVEVSRRLEQACRRSDTLIRWGGDEFLVMARCKNAMAAEELADRILAVVAEPVQLVSGHRVTTPCSVGFACYPFFRTEPEAIDWEHVVGIADRALYIAKALGRTSWAGILGTKASAAGTKSDLVALISERPERLEIEGRIQIRTALTYSSESAGRLAREREPAVG